MSSDILYYNPVLYYTMQHYISIHLFFYLFNSGWQGSWSLSHDKAYYTLDRSLIFDLPTHSCRFESRTFLIWGDSAHHCLTPMLYKPALNNKHGCFCDWCMHMGPHQTAVARSPPEADCLRGMLWHTLNRGFFLSNAKILGVKLSISQTNHNTIR